MKKGQPSVLLPFLRRRYFLFLMGCNKKLYNVLGGFYVFYYNCTSKINVHKHDFIYIYLFMQNVNVFVIYRHFY